MQNEMLKRIFGILFVILSLAGCDEPEYDYGDFLEVIAVYGGDDDEGSVFTYQARGDSPLVTLRSSAAISGALQGERVLLRYTVIDDVSDTEKEIRVDAVSKIVCDVLRQVDGSVWDVLDSTPVDMTSVWRSGNYVNVYCWVPYAGPKFQMLLVADQSTLDSEMPTLRLVYSILEGEPAFDRKCYASFDITNLWQRATCRGIRICADDTDGERIYEFNKI